MSIANELFGIFPKRNGRDITLPTSHQKLVKFRETLNYLLEIVPLRRLPEQNGKPVFIDYSALKPFRALCNDVCTEFADNNESGVSNNHIEEYVNCYKRLKDCIKLFEENRDIMDFDMSDIPYLGKGDEEYFVENKKNWYRLVYDYLVFCEGAFAKHLFKISPSQSETAKPLSHFVIAAIYYYNGDPITETNMRVIAEKYNCPSKTSGQQIKSKHYDKMNDEAYRLGKNHKRTNTERINDLNEAANYLRGEALEKCNADIKKAERIKEEGNFSKS